MRQKFAEKAWLIACVTTLSLGAHAKGPYQLSYPNEAAYFATAGGMAVTAALLEQNRHSPTASDIAALSRNDIPFFDRPYAGTWNKSAQQFSDGMLALGFAAPLPLFYMQRTEILTIGVLYLETFSLTGGGMALAKGAISRYRPFVYGGEAPTSRTLADDARRSFFSGHAALISSGFVLSATMFSDYYPESEYKPYVWGGAIGASLAGAWARVEGGMHFPSDVVVGLVVGSAIGYAVPTMHRGQRNLNIVPFVDRDMTGVLLQRNF